MMQHPKTIKEDAHGKTKQTSRSTTQDTTLAGAFISPERKWPESRRILQATSGFISCSDILEQDISEITRKEALNDAHDRIELIRQKIKAQKREPSGASAEDILEK